jgi:hypothetical protein
MILYHTTHRKDLFVSPEERDTNSVARQWFDSTHFVFATEPLVGVGPWVFEIDIPFNEVEPCMYTNIHRRERATHYAVPWQQAVDASPKVEAYEDLTGSPWNSFVVDVLDKRARKGEKELVGSWALIWASREGVARARVAERTDDVLSLRVDLTSEFDPSRDYIVVEEHEEFAQELNSPRKETWALFTLAGQAPRWQLFPSEWQEWVNNPEVTESAVRYLMRVMPSMVRDIEYAQHLESKHSRLRAWRNVGDKIADELSTRLRRDVDLGKFAGNSWTAVLAVPLRIAKRLGSYVGEEWVPPVPQPEFQHPDQSGRVLLANNYGAYPTRGPGVDHAPQDRPHEKRGSELHRGGSGKSSNRSRSQDGDPTTQPRPRW